MEEHFNFKQAIVWDKGPMGMGWHFRRSYEFVLVATKKGKEKWYDTSKKVENIIRPGDYGIKKIIPRKHQHPTEKPVELAEHFIRLMTQEDDWVLDPFMGSGSTGVAAIKTKRRFIGIELDPYWFDHTSKRLSGCINKAERGLPVYEDKYRKAPKGKGLWDRLSEDDNA